MDAITDPSIETIVIKSSSQVGKTSIEENAIGYYIDYDPSPILVVYPNDTLAQAFSTDRFSPMIRDTPCLKNKVKEQKVQGSQNTKQHKIFPLGHITMIGSNSPANISMRPIRVVIFDEIDRYPINTGGAEHGEGDVISLGIKRTSNFFNRKILMLGTPTVKGYSRIDMAYEESDQRKYYVPCPHCGEFQIMNFNQIRDKDENGKHHPRKAKYECIKCKGLWTNNQRLKAVKLGKWIATKETNRIAGFHMNELVSPWSSFERIMKEYVTVKESKSIERLQVFVNTVLGEVFEENIEKVDYLDLFKNREAYDAIVPDDVLLLSAGVDVQADRIEISVWGWGRNYESWLIEHHIIYGDPAKKEPWNDLDIFLQNEYLSLAENKYTIITACIDTGFHTKQVYDYVKDKYFRRIYAVKGIGGAGVPLVRQPTKSNMAKLPVFGIGTDTAKDIIYAKLKSNQAHLPMSCDEEYCRQLVAEVVKISKKFGFQTRKYVKAYERNEALDCFVYAFAAVNIINPNFATLARNQGKLPKIVREEKKENIKPYEPIKRHNTRPIRAGFVRGWK